MHLLILICIVGLVLGVLIWWLNTQATFIDASMKQIVKAIAILAYLIWVCWLTWQRFA